MNFIPLSEIKCFPLKTGGEFLKDIPTGGVPLGKQANNQKDPRCAVLAGNRCEITGNECPVFGPRAEPLTLQDKLQIKLGVPVHKNFGTGHSFLVKK